MAGAGFEVFFESDRLFVAAKRRISSDSPGSITLTIASECTIVLIKPTLQIFSKPDVITRRILLADENVDNFHGYKFLRGIALEVVLLRAKNFVLLRFKTFVWKLRKDFVLALRRNYSASPWGKAFDVN